MRVLHSRLVEGRPPAEWSFTLGAGAETPELEQAEQANLFQAAFSSMA